MLKTHNQTRKVTNLSEIKVSPRIIACAYLLLVQIEAKAFKIFSFPFHVRPLSPATRIPIKELRFSVVIVPTFIATVETALAA